MCCFTGRVLDVTNTCIFARARGEEQFLVYRMWYAARTELAMVLPLPVPPECDEDAVRFVNLQGYPEFFDHMRRGFPERMGQAAMSGAAGRSRSPLAVHDVGDFEASFVPTPEDFDRLDARFRLAPEIWDKLPGYADYGFAVFKLKATAMEEPEERRGWRFWRRVSRPPGSLPKQVHPMAFSFPRRDPTCLFFPTVHIHDGHVRPSARFHHTLFCQIDDGEREHVTGWLQSQRPMAEFMDAERTEGIVDGDRPGWRIRLHDQRENRDTLVGAGESVPELVAGSAAVEAHD